VILLARQMATGLMRLHQLVSQGRKLRLDLICLLLVLPRKHLLELKMMFLLFLLLSMHLMHL